MSTGPLADIRVIELAHERSVWAGKLLADMGADVILIEPPGGSPMRNYPPFVDDVPDPEKSLYFWHYNTSKRGIVLDLDDESSREQFRTLVASADILLEGEDPGRLRDLGLDYAGLSSTNPGLIMATVTPFGSDMPRNDEQAIDLTLLAGGGPVWSCGYDDHTLPPVRGGGNQGYHTGSHYAVMSVLVALIHRDMTGEGQQIDINMHAAANVTTEAGSYTWLVAQDTVQRQTGRHAAINPSMPAQVVCADGRYVNTGLPPRRPHEFAAMIEWINSLGLAEEFAEMPLLQMGADGEGIDISRLAEDEMMMAVFGAGRSAVNFIAAKQPAYEFFSGGQARGMQVGIIYSPEEVMEDPHIVERGFPTEVEHPELGRSYTYPGAPYIFEHSPWQISRRAPLLGEHTDEILSDPI